MAFINENQTLDDLTKKIVKKQQKTLDDVIVSSFKDDPIITTALPNYAEQGRKEIQTSFNKLYGDDPQVKLNTLTKQADILTEQAKTVGQEKELEKIEKENEKEKEGNILIQALDAINKPFDAILGAITGVFAYNDENFEGENFIGRVIDGMKAGWNGDIDEDTEQKLVSGASLVSAIFTGNTDTSNWTGLEKILIGAIPIVLLGFLDPMNIAFESLAASKYTLKGLMNIGKNMDKVDDAANVVRSGVGNALDYSEKTVADLYDVSTKAKLQATKEYTDQIRKTDKEFLKGAKRNQKQKRAKTKEVANAHKQANKAVTTIVNNANLMLQESLEKFNANMKSSIDTMIHNRNANSLRELGVSKLLNLDEYGDISDDNAFINAFSNIWKEPDGQINVMKMAQNHFIEGIDSGSKISVFNILDNLFTGGDNLYTFTDSQVNDILPEMVISSGLIDIDKAKTIMATRLNKNKLYQGFNYNNATLLNEYDKLKQELLVYENGLKQETITKANGKNNIKRIMNQLKQYDSVIDDIKSVQLIDFIKDPENATKPLSLRTNEEQIIYKIFESLEGHNNTLNIQLNRRFNNIDKRISSINDKQNKIEETIDTLTTQIREGGSLDEETISGYLTVIKKNYDNIQKDILEISKNYQDSIIDYQAMSKFGKDYEAISKTLTNYYGDNKNGFFNRSALYDMYNKYEKEIIESNNFDDVENIQNNIIDKIIDDIDNKKDNFAKVSNDKFKKDYDAIQRAVLDYTDMINDNYHKLNDLKLKFVNINNEVNSIIKGKKFNIDLNLSDDIINDFESYILNDNKELTKLITRQKKRIKGIINNVDGLFNDDLGLLESVNTLGFKGNYQQTYNELLNEGSTDLFNDIFSTVPNQLIQDLNHFDNPSEEILRQAKKQLFDKYFEVKNGEGQWKAFKKINYKGASTNSLTEDSKLLKESVDDLYSLRWDDLTPDTLPVINQYLLKGVESVIDIGTGQQQFFSPQIKNLVAQMENVFNVANQEIFTQALGIGDSIEEVALNYQKYLSNNPNSEIVPINTVMDQLLKNYSNFTNKISGEAIAEKGVHIPRKLNPSFKNSPSFVPKQKNISKYSNQLQGRTIIGSVKDINDLFKMGNIDARVGMWLNDLERIDEKNFSKLLKEFNVKDKQTLIDNLKNEDPITYRDTFNKFFTENDKELGDYRNYLISKTISDSLFEFRQNFPNEFDNLNLLDKLGINRFDGTDENIRDALYGKLKGLKTKKDYEKFIDDIGLDGSVLKEAQDAYGKPINQLIIDKNLDGLNYVLNAADEEQNLFLSNLGIMTKESLRTNTQVLNETINTINMMDNLRTAEQIPLTEFREYRAVDSGEFLTQIRNFLKISITGDKQGIITPQQLEIIDKDMKVLTNKFKTLEMNAKTSKEPGKLYLPKRIYNVMFDKVKEEEVSEIVKFFDTSLGWWKKLTLANPWWVFNNNFGNFLESYFMKGDFRSALRSFQNGHTLSKQLKKYDRAKLNFINDYRVNNPNATQKEMIEAFGQDLKQNPNNYKELSTKLLNNPDKFGKVNKWLVENSNGNQILTPYGLHQFKNNYANLIGIHNNEILNDAFMKANKVLAKSPDFNKNLATTQVSYNQLISAYPELEVVADGFGLTKENIINRYADYIFKMQRGDTDKYKLGLAMDLIEENRQILSNQLGENIKGIDHYFDRVKNLDSKQKEAFKKEFNEYRIGKYGSNNITEIIRNGFFDMTDMNSFERKYIARIFPFYSFIKANMVNTFKRMGRLDFRGMYGFQKMISSMSDNQSISDEMKSKYAIDKQMIPFRISKDGIVYLKAPVTSMQPFNYLLPNHTMMNEIFNSSNPIVKYIISSAAGNENLFFNADYDSKLDQIYDIFSPSMVKTPFNIMEDIEELMDPDATDLEHLDALLPKIFRVENSTEQQVTKLVAFFRMWEEFQNKIRGTDSWSASILNAYPYLGYSPLKIDIKDGF